jgi:Holliday junction resolvase-like predicted endonuclease
MSQRKSKTGRRLNAKAKGNRAEYKSIALLEAAGYRCTRAAASLGVFDLVAIGQDDVVLVQVKSNRGPSGKEMEAIKAFPCPANARKFIHVWKDRQKVPDVRTIE